MSTRFGLCAIFAAALVAAGCGGGTRFTLPLAKEYSLEEGDRVSKVQLYLDRGLVLERKVKLAVDKAITPGHSLVTRDGAHYEQVVFSRGTPCIATSLADGRITVLFERPDGLLTFAAGPGEGGAFRLVAQQVLDEDKREDHERALARAEARRQGAVRPGAKPPAPAEVSPRTHPYLYVESVSYMGKDYVVKSRDLPGLYVYEDDLYDKELQRYHVPGVTLE